MLITKIQRFSTHDGPGIRTAVFFKGCPLSCFWCHNPENRNFEKEISFDEQICVLCGACSSVCPTGCHEITHDGHFFHREKCIKCFECVKICPAGAVETLGDLIDTDRIVEEILKDRAFYGRSGGVTVTGGEPLVFPEAVEILRKCRDNNVDCCFETGGAGIPELSKEAASLCDFFYVDVKDGDPERLCRNTGGDLKTIENNIRLMDENARGSFVIRAVMLKGVNMDAASFDYIGSLYKKLKNCRGVEIIPYHALYGNKYRRLGLPDKSSKDYIPGENDLKIAEDHLRGIGVSVI